MKELKPMKSVEGFMKMKPWFESHGFRYDKLPICDGGGPWILEKGPIVVTVNAAAKGKVAATMFNREGHRPAIHIFGKDVKDVIHLLLQKAGAEPFDEKTRKMYNQMVQQIQG